jgi:hypothetical protein
MLLVRATFELHDGSRHDGFLTPAFREGEIGALHPHLLVGDKSFGFWGGMFGVRADRRSAFYKALGKRPEAIFPIQFSADPNLATGVVTGRVDGFYRGTQNLEIQRWTAGNRSESQRLLLCLLCRSVAVRYECCWLEIYQLSLAGGLATLATGRPFSNSTLAAKSYRSGWSITLKVGKS